MRCMNNNKKPSWKLDFQLSSRSPVGMCHSRLAAWLLLSRVEKAHKERRGREHASEKGCLGRGGWWETGRNARKQRSEHKTESTLSSHDSTLCIKTSHAELTEYDVFLDASDFPPFYYCWVSVAELECGLQQDRVEGERSCLNDFCFPWGDGLVCKVIARKHEDLNLDPQDPPRNWVWQPMSVTLHWEAGTGGS